MYLGQYSETAGLVCLPAAGDRINASTVDNGETVGNGETVDNGETVGHYWASTLTDKGRCQPLRRFYATAMVWHF